MRTLLYHTLCPFARMVRLILSEKSLECAIESINYWERPLSLVQYNPAATLPILKDNEHIIVESMPIIEYLEEVYPTPLLLGNSAVEKAEVRRIIHWFQQRFYQEVTHYLLYEKILRYYLKQNEPNSSAIRAAKSNILYHLDYLAYLLQNRKWLGGDKLTTADFAAAAQLSVLDYLGDVPWHHQEEVKNWYAVLKSRPSFRPLLLEMIPSFTPSSTYALLDF